MGLDVWFQEDVARALRAARVAGQEAQMAVRPGNQEMLAYWRGYEAALATIGAAFGLGEAEPRRNMLAEQTPSPSYSISLWERPDARGTWE